MKSLIGFTLFLVISMSTGERELVVSGGGIVKPGENMTLVFKVGKSWNLCTWLVYEQEDSPDTCVFLWDKDNQIGKILSATPENFSALVDYDPAPNDPNECVINVANVNDAYNCTWIVRTDVTVEQKKIDLIVADPIAEVDLQIETEQEDHKNLVAGQEGNIVCNVKGGRPAPSISVTVEGDVKSPNSVWVQTPDEKGVYESTQTLTITPTKEDNGKTVTCKAVLLDGNKEELYEPTTKTMNLIVYFAATEVEDKDVEVSEGKNATVSFEFEANPKPSQNQVRWTVTQPETNDTKSEPIAILPANTNDNKYVASEIIEVSEMKYRVEFTIFDAEQDDEKNGYELKVENDIGTTSYRFSVNVLKSGETGKPDKGSGGTKTILIFTILGVICQLAIILGAIFIYKKKARTTAPLSSMERN